MGVLVPYVDTVLAMGGDQDYETEVRARREQLGLSVAELAARAGVNEDTIRNVEGAKVYKRRPATLVRILEVLDRLESEVPGRPRDEGRITMTTDVAGRRVVVEGDPGDVSEAVARLLDLLRREGS